MEDWVAFMERHPSIKSGFEFEVMKLMSEVMAHTISYTCDVCEDRITGIFGAMFVNISGQIEIIDTSLELCSWRCLEAYAKGGSIHGAREALSKMR